MCQEFFNSSVSRFLLRFNHEKDFRDLGSGFVVVQYLKMRHHLLDIKGKEVNENKYWW